MPWSALPVLAKAKIMAAAAQCFHLFMVLRLLGRRRGTYGGCKGGLMKTGTGSAIRCIYASAQAVLVAVPVPLFISPV